MRKIVLILLFLFSVTIANAQIFYTETFDGSVCVAGSGCDPSFVAWTTTNVGVNGVNANKFYVSCQENGNAAGVCGGGCGADQSLHLGNVSTSAAAFIFCPSGDCGAAYDDSGPDEVTNIRCESPIINCTGQSGITIDFNYIENGEGTNDDATLWYFDGAVWNNINALPKTSTCGGGQGLWTAFSGLLPASADNNPNVRIGFRWVNDGNGSASDPSFAVDDITLSTSIPTPIKLLSFTGNKLTNNANLLEWVTLSEINNDFFTIERSMDAQFFQVIGKVKGAGNSNSVLDYGFVDEYPHKGINYYRLKQTDFDGTYSYSDVIAIKNETNGLEVYYHENYLNLSVSTDNVRIQVLDLAGRVVYSNNQLQKNSIDLSFLSKGIYIYRIELSNTILSDKIVVQ
ncbi:MAG: T9SS type A sorting domain-containing protein [Vicingaceae bacterium]|nr:T9SS type A sorting domain-containing protein [Vicingaceae bacterium]